MGYDPALLPATTIYEGKKQVHVYIHTCFFPIIHIHTCIYASTKMALMHKVAKHPRFEKGRNIPFSSHKRLTDSIQAISLRCKSFLTFSSLLERTFIFLNYISFLQERMNHNKLIFITPTTLSNLLIPDRVPQYSQSYV